MTVESLRALETFAAYTDAELAALASATEARTYPAGAELCVQGAPATGSFVILAGEVSVSRDDLKGEREIARLGAGAVVGQLALVDAAPRTATVRAVTEVRALVLERSVFEPMLRACAPLAVRLQEQIALAGVRQLRAATLRLSALFEPRGDETPAATAESLRAVQLAVTEWGVGAPESAVARKGS